MRTESLDYLLDRIREAVCSVDDGKQEMLIDSLLEAKTVFIYSVQQIALNLPVGFLVSGHPFCYAEGKKEGI